MHEELKGLRIVLFRDELEIHYCDPITLESIKVMKFKSEKEFENYLQKH